MARLYAGILGLLAFLTCLIRGLVHGESAEAVLWTACASLPVLAVVGAILGWCASRAVEDALGGWIQQEAAEASGGTAAKTAT